jgi:predicted DNA-binding protein (UPF0251 family)
MQLPLALPGPRLRDAWVVLNDTRPHPPTFCVHDARYAKNPYCCDFVFVSEDITRRVRAIEVDAATQDSDHQPVLLDKDLDDGLEEAPAGEAPDPAVVTVLDLERALAELPEDFRSVLLLADLEGLALHEIGQIMDIPIGTVKSRLFRARRMVRRRLADYRMH